MKWFYGLSFVLLMGAAPSLETLPCDDACQEELLKNDAIPAFIVDGCLLVKDEEAGDFMVCDEDMELLLSCAENLEGPIGCKFGGEGQMNGGSSAGAGAGSYLPPIEVQEQPAAGAGSVSYEDYKRSSMTTQGLCLCVDGGVKCEI